MSTLPLNTMFTGLSRTSPLFVGYQPPKFIQQIWDRYETVQQTHPYMECLFSKNTPQVTSIGVKLNTQGMSKTFNDNRVWFKIHHTTKDSRTLIGTLGGSIEYVNGDYVEGVATQKTLKKLIEAGMQVEYELLNGIRYQGFPKKDEAFHDYQETTAAMKELATKRPDLVKLISIGKTVEGKDIWALRFNQNAELTKPGALFVGTHHAREHLSTEIPLMLAQYLVANAEKPEIAKLLSERDITIIPMLNVDGVEYDIEDGRYPGWWRKNRSDNNGSRSKGVDTNRNYSFGWGKGKPGASDDPGSETYRGPSAFSEPETQAIKKYVEGNSNIKILLSYHTFSELILYPWGNTDDPISNEQDLKIYKTMAQKMAEWTGYTPQQSSELYITTGDTTDWAWGEHRIYSFTFELTPKTQSQGGFYPGAKVIGPTFEKNIQSALYLIDVADDPAKVLK